MTDGHAPTLLENLARQVPGVIYQFRWWPDGRSCFPFASQAIREIYEVTPEAVRDDAAAVYARLHPDDFAAVVASIERSAAALTTWEADYRVLLPQRGLRWLRGLARPERLPDGSTLWHGFISDITDRRRETEELLRREAAIDTSITGLAIADMDGILRYVNRAALETWGLDDASQAIGRRVESFWEDQGDTRAVLDAMRRAGTDSRVMTARRQDGTRRRIQVRANRIPGPDGQPIGTIASLLDITEAEANANELRLRDQAMATSLNAIVIADAEGRVHYCNAAFARLWRYPGREAVVGRHATEFGEPEAVTALLRELERDGAWQGEVVARRADGTTFDAFISANLLRDEDGRVRHLMASVADVSEAKRLQLQLAQSQKMQTIGRLAGGVAHDFNNLLTVMKGFLALARGQLPADGPATADLVQVDRAIDSAAALTQQLLAFSRRQLITPQVLDLNAAVARLRPMLQRLIGETVELRVELDPRIGHVRFDPTQMEQVLINLAVNARDAMPGGGRLTVETAEVEVDALAAAREPALRPGPHVRLDVSDTGTGMSDAVRAQLFEPFFTTKGPGLGTGLGLAMVYGAVTQNGGRIEVESAPGAGARFRILLPSVAPSGAARLTPVEGAPALGRETVWVVEDEPSIRLLTTRVLERQGYTVRAFPTGPEAIDALRREPGPLDLVVTDVIMPEMHGRALADAVRGLRPGARVLYVSGYTEDVIGQHGVLDQGVDFLAKPYSVATLARRVREALDRAVAP